jgi:hypothetical protein
MDKKTILYAKLVDFLDNKALAQAGVDLERLTWIRFVFTDDRPNYNKQGIKQNEFPSIIENIGLMPIKANYNPDLGLGGHDGARVVGFMSKAQQEANAIVGIGALFNDEFPNVVNFFKKELAAGVGISFSWELKYSDSSFDDKDNEWLTGIIPQALTAVANPAYGDRTPLERFIGELDIDDNLKHDIFNVIRCKPTMPHNDAVNVVRRYLHDRKTKN